MYNNNNFSFYIITSWVPAAENKRRLFKKGDTREGETAEKMTRRGKGLKKDK
jgi:hypothetical protein